jgi:hypothetical protein
MSSVVSFQTLFRHYYYYYRHYQHHYHHHCGGGSGGGDIGSRGHGNNSYQFNSVFVH